MDARQVFDEYAGRVHRPASRNLHCSHCGTKLRPASSPPVCGNCGRPDYVNPLPAVCTLVRRGRSVVLCKRVDGALGAGKWCLPAGFIEYDEDFLTAGRREVLEETGLSVEIERIVSVVSNFFEPDVHSLVIVMLASAAGGELRAGDDAAAAAWFDMDAALPDMAFAADAHIIARLRDNPDLGVPVDPRYAAP